MVVHAVNTSYNYDGIILGTGRRRVHARFDWVVQNRSLWEGDIRLWLEYKEGASHGKMWERGTGTKVLRKEKSWWVPRIRRSSFYSTLSQGMVVRDAPIQPGSLQASPHRDLWPSTNWFCVDFELLVKI